MLERIRVEVISKLRARNSDSTVAVLDRRQFDFRDGRLNSADVIIVDDLFGSLKDIQTFLFQVHQTLATDTRVYFLHVNHWWRVLFRQTREHPNWLSNIDILNFLKIGGFELIAQEDRWFGVLHSILRHIPLLNEFAFIRVYTTVTQDKDSSKRLPDLSVSVIVPCKDERGNISKCFSQIPVMGLSTEVIFIDGKSTDGTLEEIHKEIAKYRGPVAHRVFSQVGKGKGDAVRLGFSKASGEVLMILDSDLTVDAAELPAFYSALANGHGKFIMGSRLVYPMEKESMRALNEMANKIFGWLFSWILKQPIKDTLCGTKVLRKSDYQRIAENRDVFGDFDPFGDFDLIFGAAWLQMPILEIPVHYKARQYGQTKIDRFRHGFLLLKMCWFAFRRFRLKWC